ncbi:hypothetical protein AVEN_255516-1, partial [Araneus ventricosus]
MLGEKRKSSVEVIGVEHPTLRLQCNSAQKKSVEKESRSFSILSVMELKIKLIVLYATVFLPSISC